jgi:DNA repair photolyase
MRAASIISRNSSPDVPFDRSINPYLGCEHGCVYCYARPAHSYLDLSPGLDFETRIFYKPNAAELLLAAWEKPGYAVKPITIGANTDPYQPAEKKLALTRQLLTLFLQYEHPVSLISKGTLMRRDLDLLADLAERNLVSVAISIPTMDMQLKRKLEPRVPSANARFALLRELQQAGVPTSILVAPIIAAVNDGEIESILKLAAECKVQHAAYILLRLPHELKPIFREWLDAHLPQRADHVMSLIRQASGGQDYDNRFGHRQSGRGPYADMIAQRFRNTCRRYRLGYGENSGYQRQALDCSRFRRPGPAQDCFTFGD